MTAAVRPSLGIDPELQRKIGFTILALVIYRVGAHIFAPGVNVQAVKTDSAGVLQTQEVNVSAGDVAGTLTNGRKTVTTPGTAVALSASAACAWVSVTALPSNGDVVAVGGSGVLATVGSETGLLLGPGASVTVPTNNVSKVFVDAVVAGNGVSFLAGAL